MPEALIWGASGGIGAALVHALKDNGWRVLAAARNEAAIPESADVTYSFDAMNPATIDETALLVAQDVEDHLDLVVYAAGELVAAKLSDLSPEEWAATVASNLDGPYLAARASLNLLSKEGHLVLIGAYVDKITLPRMGAYAAAKAGLETMFAVLRKENRRQRMTLVRPGAVTTDFWENVPFNIPESAMQAEEVAKAIMTHHHGEDSGILDL